MYVADGSHLFQKKYCSILGYCLYTTKIPVPYFKNNGNKLVFYHRLIESLHEVVYAMSGIALTIVIIVPAW